jgi:FlgO protein
VKTQALLLVAISAVVAGCASKRPAFPPTTAASSLLETNLVDTRSERSANLIQSSVGAVAQLAASLPTELRGARTMVTTIVDINQVSSSAPLGRTLAEHVATAWVAQGFRVVEIRMRDHLLLDEAQGELMLSRSSVDIATSQKAELIITGTYSAAANVTYVTLKALRASDGFVESAVSFELPNSSDVRKLLGLRDR